MKTSSRLRAFTLPEAILTMVILVIFVGVGAGLYFQAWSVSNRLDAHQNHVEEETLLASVLPSLCLAVRPPEWVSEDQVFGLTPDGLVAKYWDGSPEKTLIIRVVGNVLEVATPGAFWRWKALGPWKIEYWRHSQRIVGLTVHWEKDSAEHVLSFPWGGRLL